MKILPMRNIFIALFSMFSKTSTTQPNTPAAVLRDQVAQHKAPGAAYIFFDRKSVIYSHYEGLADVASGVPVRAATTFNGFSITKTVTALAILQLEERGLLSLSDHAAKYIPGFPYGPDITIRHLLTHTAGIPNPIPLKWVHLTAEHSTFNRNAFFADIFRANSKLKSLPGDKFAYTNLGYVLLGQVIEQVSQLSYEEYVTTNILGKIAPDSELGFTLYPATHAKGYQRKTSIMNFALNFLIDKKKFMGPSADGWKSFKYSYLNGAPYGGLMISAPAMAKLGQAMLNNQFLSSEASQKYFAENATNNGKPTGMGISWFTAALGGHRYVHHAGGGGGYYIEFRLYPQTGHGSILIFNRSGMKNENFLDKLDPYFLQQLRWNENNQ